jgi:hypothetical protein
VAGKRDITRDVLLQKQLQTAQKMESVGTLAGGIAHDFNNVLTVIIGFGEMVKLRIANDPKAISDLDEVLRSAERASVLTRQLLTFARRQVVAPVILDLNEVMTGLVKLLRKVTREDIEIKTAHAECPVMIRADCGQVEQVVMNLYLNARDAAASCGADADHLRVSGTDRMRRGGGGRNLPPAPKRDSDSRARRGHAEEGGEAGVRRDDHNASRVEGSVLERIFRRRDSRLARPAPGGSDPPETLYSQRIGEEGAGSPGRGAVLKNQGRGSG